MIFIVFTPRKQFVERQALTDARGFGKKSDATRIIYWRWLHQSLFTFLDFLFSLSFFLYFIQFKVKTLSQCIHDTLKNTELQNNHNKTTGKFASDMRQN
jgi:hypothetical protein